MFPKALSTVAHVLLFLALGPLVGCSEDRPSGNPAPQSAPQSAPQQPASQAANAEQPSPRDRLGQSSRDLAAPMQLGDTQGDPNRQQVLVYYANESSAAGPGAANLRTLTEWLRGSKHPEIQALADSIERDGQAFPQAVEQEIEAIKTSRAKLPVDERPGVAIVTNSLARSGQMEVAPPGEEFRSVSIELPQPEDTILKAWPLAAPQVLAAVLDHIAEQFPPAEHEYVLVSKSHGSGEYLLTTRIAIDTSQHERDKIVATLEQGAADRTEQFKQQGQPLTAADGTAVVVEGGGQVYALRGTLRAEGLGNLYLAMESDKLLLVDPLDRPVTTSEGKTIVLHDGALRLDADDEPLRVGDQPAVVEVLVGLQSRPVRLASLDDTARGELFAQRSQRLLVGSAEKLGLRLDKDNALDKEMVLDKSGRLDPMAANTLDKENMLDKTGRLDPMGANTLDKENMLGKDGTLDPMAANTLGIDPFANLGVDDQGKPIAGYRGTTKSEFVAALIAAGGQGWRFPLIFAESCKSQLGPSEASLLKSEADHIGYLWSSDLHGLQYQTISYDDLFARVAGGERLSHAMMETLQEQYVRERTERAASGTAPSPPSSEAAATSTSDELP